MSTLCRAYTSELDADAAVDRVLSALPAATVQVLMGETAQDARDLPVGSFAGATSNGEPVGSYAGVAHSGSEAMGGFAGNADAQRRGAFADVDRETVTTHSADVTRVRGMYA